MSGKPAEQDNSIEEILASIRQIISEDEPKTDAVAPEPVAAAPEPVFEPAPAPASAQDAADDVFELIDRVVAEEEPEPEPEPVPAPLPAPEPEKPEIEVDLRDQEMEEAPIMRTTAPAPVADDSPIFTDSASAATLGAFSKLSETILLERQRNISGATITLEDIVKELLSPLLRQWIDHHVPGIVERLVQEELEKLARQAREG